MFELLRNKINIFKSWQSSAADQPVLSPLEQEELMTYARNIHQPLFSTTLPSSHSLHGDITSFQRGQGYEFDDNRAYQAGDESRMINWRLYARMGELYTRIMNEERRACCFTIVDRSASMRFGTHEQLKVTLAVKLAASYTWHALTHGLATGGAIINRSDDIQAEDYEWFPPQAAQSRTEAYLQALYAPCPPLDFDTGEVPGSAALNTQLQHCLDVLPHGSHIVILSDLNFFYNDNDPELNNHTGVKQFISLVQALSAVHDVTVIQVMDNIETVNATQPMEDEEFLIETTTGQHVISFSKYSPVTKSYLEVLTTTQVQVEKTFKQAGISYYSFNTLLDYKDCLSELGKR